MTPLRETDAARRLRWRIERIRDPDHPLYKPRLRGWIHAVMAPLTLAASAGVGTEQGQENDQRTITSEQQGRPCR